MKVGYWLRHLAWHVRAPMARFPLDLYCDQVQRWLEEEPSPWSVLELRGALAILDSAIDYVNRNNADFRGALQSIVILTAKATMIARELERQGASVSYHMRSAAVIR